VPAKIVLIIGNIFSFILSMLLLLFEIIELA